MAGATHEAKFKFLTLSVHLRQPASIVLKMRASSSPSHWKALSVASQSRSRHRPMLISVVVWRRCFGVQTTCAPHRVTSTWYDDLAGSYMQTSCLRRAALLLLVALMFDFGFYTGIGPPGMCMHRVRTCDPGGVGRGRSWPKKDGRSG